MTQVDQALETLQKDGVVIFPTETVLGIGCRLGSPKAIERLYRIKNREKGKPTSVVVSDLDQAEKIASFTPLAQRLAEKFWPGALTLILRALDNKTQLIQGKGGTIGLRIPSHPLLLTLLARLGEPVLAPSANFAGASPTANLGSVDSELRSMVDYVVNEDAQGEKPSTVLDLTKQKPIVLREGSISLEQINQILGEKTLG